LQNREKFWKELRGVLVSVNNVGLPESKDGTKRKNKVGNEYIELKHVKCMKELDVNKRIL
jgi:hypothetical protein